MTIYSKSFIALDGNQRLTGAVTAQLHPYDRYTCHLCGSSLVFHPEWGTNRPWFEHTWEDLTENGRHHCPYVRPEPKEVRRVRMLCRYVPDVLPVVRKADWHCSECDSDYHGERYCMSCRTGDHSNEIIRSEVA
ncbi:putative zinc ribbon protein [Enterobacter sp. 22325]|uniref:putative zinc ribbon protein n=1 Tax=Enterobacter sp. 22325 TaxID=3453911 RepID=UPI003F843BBC